MATFQTLLRFYNFYLRKIRQITQLTCKKLSSTIEGVHRRVDAAELLDPHTPIFMWKTAPRSKAASLCNVCSFKMLHICKRAACPKSVPNKFLMICHDVWQYVSQFTVRHNAMITHGSASSGNIA